VILKGVIAVAWFSTSTWVKTARAHRRRID
jgi:hypothetical protein